MVSSTTLCFLMLKAIRTATRCGPQAGSRVEAAALRPIRMLALHPTDGRRIGPLRLIIKTLGVKPLSNLQLLRNENSLEHVASVSVNGLSKVLNLTGASFELIAEVADFERGNEVGFEVRRSSTGDEEATIVYDDAEKKVIIDRSKGSTADCAVFADNNVKPISESICNLHDLFYGASQSDVCETTREKLSFHVFVNVSSIEVFVNDRFSLSARIYPCATQSKSDGIALTASGDAIFRAGWPGSR
ncbi:hypothetical protein L917_17693, partial [Phytophthora nicotianae]